MKNLKIEQLDYRYILIENYKKLNLSEEELITLLLIDNVEKENPTLITADLLSLKMNIDEKRIDDILVSLYNRNFISYVKFNNIMVTSIKKTKDKLIELFKRDLILDSKDSLLITNEDDLAYLYQLIEEKIKRPLTSIELETVHSWLKDGIDKQIIINAINECALKSKSISLKAIDKTIVKTITSNDRKKEGYSVVDESNKKNIDETIELASYDWGKK